MYLSLSLCMKSCVQMYNAWYIFLTYLHMIRYSLQILWMRQNWKARMPLEDLGTLPHLFLALPEQ